MYVSDQLFIWKKKIFVLNRKATDERPKVHNNWKKGQSGSM